MKVLIWVVYDIQSTPRRTKVAKACKEQGLYRVQKSVFLGNINTNEIDELAIRCGDLIDQENDRVYIFPFCEEDFKKIRLIGQAFDKALVTDEILSKFF
jgi:CRISPR-associated protein Cas2